MKITEITRRNIISYLLNRKTGFSGSLEMIDFIGRIWPLSSMPSTDQRFKNAHADIWQHMINNYDWDESYLLVDYLDLLTCDDDTFIQFVELSVHPTVVPDKDLQLESVEKIGNMLDDDEFKFESTGAISKRPIYKIIYVGEELSTEVYEVVLSFAGEDREYVEEVAKILKERGIKLFYDKYEEATLWGKDLVEHLDQVYRGSARYCVMFISKHYATKLWAIHERRSAFAKALQERQEYILPARFDDTEIPGIRPTIGYVDLRTKTPSELVDLILEKLGHNFS